MKKNPASNPELIKGIFMTDFIEFNIGMNNKALNYSNFSLKKRIMNLKRTKNHVTLPIDFKPKTSN